MSNKIQVSGGGVGLGGLLFVAFLVMKLCGVINWSWWWVCAPLWLPLAIVLGVIVVIVFIMLIAFAIKAAFS